MSEKNFSKKLTLKVFVASLVMSFTVFAGDGAQTTVAPSNEETAPKMTAKDLDERELGHRGAPELPQHMEVTKAGEKLLVPESTGHGANEDAFLLHRSNRVVVYRWQDGRLVIGTALKPEDPDQSLTVFHSNEAAFLQNLKDKLQPIYNYVDGRLVISYGRKPLESKPDQSGVAYNSDEAAFLQRRPRVSKLNPPDLSTFHMNQEAMALGRIAMEEGTEVGRLSGENTSCHENIRLMPGRLPLIP